MRALDHVVINIIIFSYVNTYVESILVKEQCIDNYIHKINQIGNTYEILALAVLTHLLLLYRTEERLFPLNGTEKAFAFMKELYKSII